MKNIREHIEEEIMTIKEFSLAYGLSKWQTAAIMDKLDMHDDWDETTFTIGELEDAMDSAKADPDSGWFIDVNENKKIASDRLPDLIVESILSEEKHKCHKLLNESKWKVGDIVYQPETGQVYEVDGRDVLTGKLELFNLTNPGNRIKAYEDGLVECPEDLKKKYKP